MNENIAAIRGHHLLCLLTYIGRGYSQKFVENFDKVITQIHNGHSVRVVEGLDQICQGCARYGLVHGQTDPACRSAAMLHWDRCVIDAINKTFHPMLDWKIGSHLLLTPENVARLRRVYAEGPLRASCSCCDWINLCTVCAMNGYQDVKLFP